MEAGGRGTEAHVHLSLHVEPGIHETLSQKKVGFENVEDTENRI